MGGFYASVELLRYPDLRGLPVVIGGGRRAEALAGLEGAHRYTRLRDHAGRGVVTTSTYQARALGVHSAMELMKSAALAPEAAQRPAPGLMPWPYASSAS